MNHPRFRQFFAVHELEAWLLSDPSLFLPEIRNGFPGSAANPETVNFNTPPAKLLNKLYEAKTGRKYKKTTHGIQLFKKLNPDVAYGKCPRLAEMLDEMLRLAKQAGL